MQDRTSIDHKALADRLKTAIGANALVADTDEFCAIVIRQTLNGADLMTRAEHNRLLETHRMADRTALADAEATIRKLRTELADADNDVRRRWVARLRRRVNEATLPSRYRREGALQVVDWLDPEKEN